MTQRIDINLSTKYNINNTCNCVAREFNITNDCSFLIWTDDFETHELFQSPESIPRIITQLLNKLNLIFREDWIKCKSYNVQDKFPYFTFTWYSNDPNKYTTFNRNIEVESQGCLFLTFTNTDKIMFNQYITSTEHMDANEQPTIIYPIKEIENRKDEDMVHVLRTLVLPNVFRALNLEIPGDNIKKA